MRGVNSFFFALKTLNTNTDNPLYFRLRKDFDNSLKACIVFANLCARDLVSRVNNTITNTELG